MKSGVNARSLNVHLSMKRGRVHVVACEASAKRIDEEGEDDD